MCQVWPGHVRRQHHSPLSLTPGIRHRQTSWKRNSKYQASATSQPFTALDCVVDRTPLSKGATVLYSDERLPDNNVALTRNVEEDIPDCFLGVVSLNTLRVLERLSVYGEVLQERRSTRTIRVEQKSENHLSLCYGNSRSLPSFAFLRYEAAAAVTTNAVRILPYRMIGDT